MPLALIPPSLPALRKLERFPPSADNTINTLT